MSTRDEILAALADAPDGLTVKELAPKCPAAECDEIIVARLCGALRLEDVVHIDGFRAGANIYKAGKNPNVAQPSEPKVTLAGFVPPQARGAGEATKAILEMRGISRPAPAPARPPAPSAPASRSTEPAPHKEGADMTIREKIEKVLKEHGPLTTREMREHGLKEGTLSQHCLDLTKRKVIVVLGGGTRSKIYGLPGQKMSDRKEVEDTPSVPKVAKAKKGVREKKRREETPPQAPRREPAPVPAPANGSAQFAINEHGELGIEVEDRKLRLDPEAFGRLREFIEKTKPVWELAGA